MHSAEPARNLSNLVPGKDPACDAALQSLFGNLL